jgi:UDP-glucose 4-epimerase
MKSVWITGGKGFIGRNLAKYLSDRLFSVYGLGHGSWPEHEYASWGFNSWLNADIDFSSLSQLASSAGYPDVIFHLAGGSSVGPSIDSPYEDFQRTVDTTAKLLDWVRQHSPSSKVIATSSAAIYGARYLGNIKEDSTSDPFSPYGAHKSMLEVLFHSFRESFDLKLGVIRLFSVYGQGLQKQLLWDICQKLETSQTSQTAQIRLHGTGQELRDWIHVQDACSLLLEMALAHDMPKVINGGTGTATSILEIANLVIDAWGGNTKIEFSGIGRRGDPASLVADITLARKLGFTPSITIQAGVTNVVSWFRNRSS